MTRLGRLCVLALFALTALAAGGCALAPRGTYAPNEGDPRAKKVYRALSRAAAAAEVDDSGWQVGLIASSELNAQTDGSGRFYFTDGIADLDQEILDAVVAHEIAHQALGHLAKRTLLSATISAAFTIAGVFVPGLGWANHVVNPLVMNAYSRVQELEADLKAMELLGRMGHPSPKATLLSTLTLLRARHGDRGNWFSNHPSLGDRLAALNKLTDPVGPSGPEMALRQWAGPGWYGIIPGRTDRWEAEQIMGRQPFRESDPVASFGAPKSAQVAIVYQGNVVAALRVRPNASISRQMVQSAIGPPSIQHPLPTGEGWFYFENGMAVVFFPDRPEVVDSFLYFAPQQSLHRFPPALDELLKAEW